MKSLTVSPAIFCKYPAADFMESQILGSVGTSIGFPSQYKPQTQGWLVLWPSHMASSQTTGRSHFCDLLAFCLELAWHSAGGDAGCHERHQLLALTAGSAQATWIDPVALDPWLRQMTQPFVKRPVFVHPLVFVFFLGGYLPQ